jgi:hypothetical protein
MLGSIPTSYQRACQMRHDFEARPDKSHEQARIAPGKEVIIRDALGTALRKRAISGVERGRDFPVVWACGEHEWAHAQAEGRAPDGVPWPAEDVELAG